MEHGGTILGAGLDKYLAVRAEGIAVSNTKYVCTPSSCVFACSIIIYDHIYIYVKTIYV